MNSPIRRNVTEADIQIVYRAIRKYGNASMVQIRREVPTINSTAIGKAIGELKDRGLVVKDVSDWPPKFRDTGAKV